MPKCITNSIIIITFIVLCLFCNSDSNNKENVKEDTVKQIPEDYPELNDWGQFINIDNTLL